MAVTCWPSTMPALPTFGRRPPGRKLPRKKQRTRPRQATAGRRTRRSSSHEPDSRRTVVYASPCRRRELPVLGDHSSPNQRILSWLNGWLRIAFYCRLPAWIWARWTNLAETAVTLGSGEPSVPYFQG